MTEKKQEDGQKSGDLNIIPKWKQALINRGKNDRMDEQLDAADGDDVLPSKRVVKTPSDSYVKDMLNEDFHDFDRSF